MAKILGVHAAARLFGAALCALSLGGCPATGGGDSISKGDAENSSGEDANTSEQIDATGSNLDADRTDALPVDAARSDARSPDTDAGPDAVVGDASGLKPDAASGDCREGETRVCEGCAQGNQSCLDGAWGPCEGQAETCNGLDDNCDGAIDEAFGALGQICLAGVGECEAEGVVVCGPDGRVVLCGASAGEPSVEICDGLDNDCDGTVDIDAAGRPLGDRCYTGPEGTEGVGVCRAGGALCDADGLPGDCSNEVVPSPELCDGLDNDCDGVTDEGPDGGALVSACFEGPEDALDQGLCHAGIRRCDNGFVGACEGQVLPTEEVCDSVDNDCDGLVDNPPDRNGQPQSCDCAAGEVRACYSGPEGTEGRGPCVGGTQTCLADGSSFGICDGQVLPQAEICDGLDNDCSGEADDALVGAGQRCSVGVGACAGEGLTICDPMAFELVCNALPSEPSLEACDGVDNNCDGRTDEDFPVGEACALGEGRCMVQGALVCDAEGGVSCDATPGDPLDEVCDGVDNDCDGAIDNGFDLGSVCEVGEGACAALGVLVCDAQGAASCSAVAGAPAPEVCDGIDNDCDARLDNDPSDVGGPCATELPGICALGTLACVEGGLACAATTEPAPERCDGLDNDCNGVADDTVGGALLTQACYDGPAGTNEVGACVGGLQTCRGGQFGPCEGQRLPGAEICDRQDNNCDGRVDNLAMGACACEPGAVADCYTGAAGTSGVGACRGGRWTCNPDGLAYGACEGQVVPGSEVCDGVDNDCNNSVDDSIPGTGGGCSLGVGECLARGINVCDPRAGRIICNAQAGQPRPEVCDARDNDCNGAVDNGLGLGAACTSGVGVCLRAGVQICGANGGVTCGAVAGNPVAEVCNNLDDDCDGTIDDGLNLGAVCTVGVGACQRQGRNICAANGGVVCNVAAGNPAAEVCDGVDNNCNGTTDENNPGGGGACNTGLQGVCSAGVLACVNAGLRCQQSVQSSAEVCDARDNNCNGTTDESAAGGPLSQACYDGPAGTQNRGICRGGTQSCQAGAYGACVGQILPAPADLCDGLDNNCNGTVDEQPGGQMCACQPGTTRACYSGPAGTQGVGICRAGTQACTPDGLGWGACGGETLPAAEICDAADNNCNGTVDDAPNVGLACSVGQGDCLARGANRCNVQTRQVECSATAGQPAAEVCDGRDNNCNGTTDDVAGLGGACTNGVGACLRAGNQVCDVANRVLVCNAVAGQPVAETCDGIDNNCNGQSDDGRLVGVGLDCQAGVGACLRSGLTVCNGAAGVACGVQAGAPAPELCDNVDNNCNGITDDNPTDVGQRCTVGVGACQAAGLTVCDGRLFCNGQPGSPTREVCDSVDNDCDAQTDESLDCTVYKSCLDAKVRGAAASGIYRVQPGARDPITNIYCDQVTDSGGWTLVGASAGTALDDAASVWYTDLLGLAPAVSNAGVWTGLRGLGSRFDLRFACRSALGAEGAPMNVDLSFYRTPWYSEITAGPDASSCFSEVGTQDFPTPARRNNLNGEFRARGDQWNSGAFAGEDACGSPDDFSVDFDDRGMDSNQADGTDWGEDDGALKCGANGLATGQWFVFARERGRVAIVGVPVQAQVLADGFLSENLALASTPGNLTAETYEAALIGRYSLNWPSVTEAVRDTLRVFTDNGGNIVTEYDGAGLFGSGFAQTYGYLAGAAATLNQFRYTTNGGTALAAGTPIDVVLNADPIVTGLPDPFSAGGGTEFFLALQAGRLPTYLTTVATFAGNGTPQFPQGVHPAIARGRRCGGNVLLANFDWSDNIADANLRTMLRNLLGEAIRPPLATTEDVCRDRVRTNLMVCGGSQRSVSTFARGGQGYQVIDACAPDANTQAFFVTRNGAGQVNANALRTYMDAGGITITEYTSSDEVFNILFGAAVVQGAVVGSCGDNVMPAVQFGPLDALWDDNRLVATAVGATGCGANLAAFPNIVPLGGPAGAAVTLAYRDYNGRGRLWMVESDWQDNQAEMSADSLGLMHYMLTHGAGRQLSLASVQNGLYLPDVQRGGFNVCYSGNYGQVAPLATITTACDASTLMLACRQAGSNTLQVAGMAARADVLFDVGNVPAAFHNANGIDWYYSPTYSWGFAPAGAGVSRNSCDTGATLTEQRMCWHTSNNSLQSGWSCGASRGIGDAAWERLVLERGGGL